MKTAVESPRYVAKVYDGKQGVFDTARNRHSPFDLAKHAELAAQFCNETPAFAAKLAWDYLPGSPRRLCPACDGSRITFKAGALGSIDPSNCAICDGVGFVQ